MRKRKPQKWTPNNRKPRLGEEYLVVWDLQDGQPPVVTVMQFSTGKSKSMQRGWWDQNIIIADKAILLWKTLPAVPKCKKCDMCGHYFVGKSYQVTDENMRIQRGIVSCGCHYKD